MLEERDRNEREGRGKVEEDREVRGREGERNIGRREDRER